jgi:hypothetical protein
MIIQVKVIEYMEYKVVLYGKMLKVKEDPTAMDHARVKEKLEARVPPCSLD